MIKLLTTLAKRPFAELILQCMELVGTIGPPYKTHQVQLIRNFTGSIILCHRAIPYRVKTLDVLLENSFLPSIHCREADFKARRRLFMIGRRSMSLEREMLDCVLRDGSLVANYVKRRSCDDSHSFADIKKPLFSFLTF